KTLMVFPTKALAHDQLHSLAASAPPGVTVAAYDGDCSPQERSWVREHADIVLTNPEMLHLGILSNHARWEGFLRHLDLVVVDEMHVLRGLFGSHAAHVLRRLRRLVTTLRGTDPTFAFTSATIGRASELAGLLSGLPAMEISRSGAPTGERTTVLWNPFDPAHADAARPSLNVETASIAAEMAAAGLRTLVFCRSRRASELVANEVRQRLGQLGVDGAGDLVRSYRAGYLAEERREIETALSEDRLACVVATNALELGIDIEGLDGVVLSGFPGTIASFRQQIGRAGRGTRSALAVLVAGEDQLDQWMMRHPREAFRRDPEPAVVNPANPHVLHPHLGCAADEVPLTQRDEQFWPDVLEDAVRELVLDDRLRVEDSSTGPIARWAGRGAPAPTIGLRSAAQGEFRILRPDGSTLGTVDASRAADSLHDGAVYLHQGASWRVTELDTAGRVAHVEAHDGSTYTQTRRTTDIRLLDEAAASIVESIPVHLGHVEVTTTVTGFVVKSVERHEVLERHELELPPATLHTTAIWWTFSEELIRTARVNTQDLPGALHAAEHAGIGILPLFAMCDRWDVGGVSTAHLADTGTATIVIHDAQPGGAGVAAMAFDAAPRHLNATLEVLKNCACGSGCPSCVQSPKCGNGNEPLDKHAAAALLRSGVHRRR
ncbi:MAG: DEAD/DEAH box helicase, partial [Microthrixaceae bacterium]